MTSTPNPGAASTGAATGASTGASAVYADQSTTQGSVQSHPSEGRSVGDIVGDITKDLTTLMRQEIELAKTEAKQDAAKAGKGAGMLAGAGVAAHLMLIFVSLALVYLLDNVMPVELAALIVGVLWAIIAAVLALTGKKQLQSMNKLETTQKTLKEDVQWAKAQKNN